MNFRTSHTLSQFSKWLFDENLLCNSRKTKSLWLKSLGFLFLKQLYEPGFMHLGISVMILNWSFVLFCICVCVSCSLDLWYRNLWVAVSCTCVRVCVCHSHRVTVWSQSMSCNVNLLWLQSALALISFHVWNLFLTVVQYSPARASIVQLY